MLLGLRLLSRSSRLIISKEINIILILGLFLRLSGRRRLRISIFLSPCFEFLIGKGFDEEIPVMEVGMRGVIWQFCIEGMLLPRAK